MHGMMWSLKPGCKFTVIKCVCWRLAGVGDGGGIGVETLSMCGDLTMYKELCHQVCL